MRDKMKQTSRQPMISLPVTDDPIWDTECCLTCDWYEFESEICHRLLDESSDFRKHPTEICDRYERLSGVQ